MYEPFEVGQKFRVIPPEYPGSTDGRIDLVMQRGAFGSGEHETSVSCLEALERLPEMTGRQVLDLGSGTGILAIAALKLGAAHALCVDIATEAVATARTNSKINGVAEHTDHLAGTLDDVDQGPFDLVLANIYGDILLSLAPSLALLTAPGGRLILSGILWEYNFDVRQAYERNGCTLLSNRMLNEFSTLMFSKNQK